MHKRAIALGLGLGVSLLAVCACAAEKRKEARLDIAPGGTVSVVNNGGTVNLKAAPGRQVLIAYTTHSDKVEVDQTVTEDKRRIDLRSHVLHNQKPTIDESKVDYDISVPAGVAVSVSTATAPITADDLSGDLTLSSDAGQIIVHNLTRSHLRIRGVGAPVTLNNVSGGAVDVTANNGTVEMVNVSGPKVNVGTSSGNISYKGDCSGGGNYTLTTHTGNIDVSLPQTASVDLTARSVTGSVENDFPLEKKTHTSFVPKAGSSFAGTSNSGSSSVELQSFSGRIRVKKQ